MFQSHGSTHHGHAFTIEAEGWPDRLSADAAAIALQSWATGLPQEDTARLHSALRQETEALVQDLPYDRNAAPLPALREAQRQAVRAGLGGAVPEGRQPTVTLEAYQVTQT